jgi:hypothetical protein
MRDYHQCAVTFFIRRKKTFFVRFGCPSLPASFGTLLGVFRFFAIIKVASGNAMFDASHHVVTRFAEALVVVSPVAFVLVMENGLRLGAHERAG